MLSAATAPTRSKSVVVAGQSDDAWFTGAARHRASLDALRDELAKNVAQTNLQAATIVALEARVREHFAVTQREADRLLGEALPRLHAQLDGLFDIAGFKRRMQADRAKADMSRWHELMVLSIARLLTAQYALALATLHLRTKLNIVARHDLLEVAADGGEARALQPLTKRRFLSMERLLTEGLQPLADAVLAAVRAHLTEDLAATRLATPHSGRSLRHLSPARAGHLQAGVAMLTEPPHHRRRPSRRRR